MPPEARQGRLAFCILTENDLERSDQDIRARIQHERADWRNRARNGATHGFLIVAVAGRIAYSRPCPALQTLAATLCRLYLGRDEPDTIHHDELILEIRDGDQIAERRRWKVGVNYFSAQGDGRWWSDHRIPGGMAFSMNSVGHMARTRAEQALAKSGPRVVPGAARERLVYWALPKAMKTIGANPTDGDRGTWLVEHGTFEDDVEPPTFEMRQRWFRELQRAQWKAMDMNLNARILAALGPAPHPSTWPELMRLFEADREAFYLLACHGGGPGADPRTQQLAALAGRVRSAIAETYAFVPHDDGATLTTNRGTKTFIPAEVVERVAEFLRSVDGKTSGDGPGRDFIGQAVSEAEVTFKLGDATERAAQRDHLSAMRTAKPQVLRLDDEELWHLRSQPPYVVYELLHCARRTVLAPTAVCHGLRRGDEAPAKVNDGWAFCGKPRETYLNDGTAVPGPNGMVHVVYADAEGYIFDWDWVLEDPGAPGHPLDFYLRFDDPNALTGEARLDLPRDIKPGHFDRTQACYSSRGDCLFCYITGDESYATRINPDLTVFQKFSSGEYTGFKIKNVRRILQVDQSIVIQDAPKLTVHVDSMLLTTQKLHPKEENAETYAVLIRALVQTAGDRPKVQLPPQVAETVGA